jgi:hypothetical protein
MLYTVFLYSIVAMLFKPPLTREHLHDIGARKDPQDIVELLWEIKRLRALALKIDQVQRSITVSGGMVLLLESLREDLRNEPCVQEDERLRIK